MAAAAPDPQPLRRSSSYKLLPPNMSELSVVLLGSSWSERNSVRRFILGNEDNFLDRFKPCIKFSVTLEDKILSVINTPDLQFTTADQQTEFIKECMRTSDPGPHVFLLVLQPEDFTEEEKNRIYRLLKNIDDRSFDHSLILILPPRQEGSVLKETYMNNPPVKELITRCRYRYLKKENIDRSELITRLGQIVKGNKGEHVSYGEPTSGALLTPAATGFDTNKKQSPENFRIVETETTPVPIWRHSQNDLVNRRLSKQRAEMENMRRLTAEPLKTLEEEGKKEEQELPEQHTELKIQRERTEEETRSCVMQ